MKSGEVGARTWSRLSKQQTLKLFFKVKLLCYIFDAITLIVEQQIRDYYGSEFIGDITNRV